MGYNYRDNYFFDITTSGILMMFASLAGLLISRVVKKKNEKVMLPILMFSAGSLIGGAFFHMLPEITENHSGMTTWVLTALGFFSFLVLEIWIHRIFCKDCDHEEGHEHDHKEATDLEAACPAREEPEPHIPAGKVCCPAKEQEHRRALGWMILLGDGLHNFLGGMSVGTLFLVDRPAGWMVWLAALAHEIPQEIGDLVVMGWSGMTLKKAALLNFFAAGTFLLGEYVAALAAGLNGMHYVIPFSAGNFLFIGMTDLLPEMLRWREPHGKMPSLSFQLLNSLCMLLGLALLAGIKAIFEEWEW